MYRMRILIAVDGRFLGKFYQFKIEYLDIASLQTAYCTYISHSDCVFITLDGFLDGYEKFIDIVKSIHWIGP